MTRQGGVTGGLVSQCHNEQSGSTYYVSTAYQQADVCWTTVVIASIERRSLFALTKQHKPDPSRILKNYIRNTQNDANEVHELVVQMVTTQPQEVWDSVGPDSMPPDGFNEITQRAFEGRWGKALSSEIRARFRKNTSQVASSPIPTPASSKLPDIPNAVISILNSELKSSYVSAECNRRPKEELAQFTMAFTCYILWLVKISLESKMASEQINLIFEEIHKSIIQCSWYQNGLFEKIWASIQEYLPTMRSGQQTGVLLPLVHVIIAANLAGCQLSNSNDAVFNVYTITLVKSIPEQISFVA